MQIVSEPGDACFCTFPARFQRAPDDDGLALAAGLFHLMRTMTDATQKDSPTPLNHPNQFGNLMQHHRENDPPALRVMARPADANIYGDVFGGWIMSHVDIAASIVASRRADGRVATVAVNSFLFKEPVFVGDLLSFYADIVRTGRTSMTIEVEVLAQRMRAPNEVVKVTEATLTFVATGEDRRPRPLP